MNIRDKINNKPLNESTEDNFLDKIVDQFVSETIIDYDNKDFEAPFIPPSLTNNLTIPFSFSSSFFSSFLFKYGREVYGLTKEETEYVWQEYEKIIRDKINNKPLNESTEDSFLDKIVKRFVDETHVFNDRGQLRANPPFFQSEWDDMEVEGRITGVVGGMPLAELINSVESKEFDSSLAFMDFKYYCKQMYGLTWEECHEVWDKYREALYNTDFSHLYNPFHHAHLNESTEDSFLDKIVSQLVGETIVEYGNSEEPLAYPPWIVTDNEGVDLGVLLDSGSNHWNFNEFSLYVHDIYGLTEDETKDIWEPYLDRVHEKFNLYILQNTLNHPWRINENLNSKIHKAVNDTFKKNKGLKGQHRIRRYFRKQYGLDKWEADQAMVQYLSKQQSLNESEDNFNTFTDDKDFPFLNKLANHIMSITEIERNAIMFPFIDGYISDGNFHKYFNGTPYDQLPLDAILQLDEYLKDFGLTENEKEIWWDIYVIKVMEAIGRRDLKIIDNYGELNEHAEPEDPIYEKIANTTANESEIVISPAPYNKMFLRSTAWKEAQHIENVIDQLTGRIKDVVPDRFVKHLKEIYNIKYPTFVNKVWRLYRYKIINKIKKAQQRQISPKQQKFFDHILKTLVDGTEVQTTSHFHDERYEDIAYITPPFLNHGQSEPAFHEDSIEWNDFSFFGSGYSQYMHDVYGLNDKEIKKLWAPYYRGVQKKVDELIERDRIIYGDD